MAEDTSRLKDPNGTVKFSISEEGLEDTPETEEKLISDNGRPKGSSRFKVAKVEFVNEKPETSLHVDGDGDAEARGDTPSPAALGRDRTRTRTTSRQESVCSSQDLPISPTDSLTHTYDTRNLKTFGRNTLETLPHLDHYRNVLSATGGIRKRPTLLELHEQEKEEENPLQPEGENGQAVTPFGQVEDTTAVVKPQPVVGPKFGWIKGVLVRCLLNIWGVMLFLRLSWVVGQSGVLFAALIILLSGFVTTITALSMSAICTNGEVKGGGAYYMISRSLGPEFGGAIGLIFSVANAVAVAMYVVGFAETIRDILKNHDCLMVDEINDVRIIGLVTICVLLGVAMIGMEWEARAQIVLLVILLIAIADFIIGTFIPPSQEHKAKGITGYSATTFLDNLGPDFRDGEGFFSVFAIFFPAATGILAGANISGDLKDAQEAIPKGTLYAILITTITYIAMAWMAGAVVVRDAAGLLGMAPLLTANATEIVIAFHSNSTAEDVTIAPTGGATCQPPNCPYGLLNDMQVMQMTSAFGPLVITGIVAATLSSALASLVSAPKVFQAVCKDKIFPKIHIFAKGYGKGDEPRRAYLLAFTIGVACICIGDLNAIAPLISNFFLMSYALINYSCFDASLAKSPGWRPAFRFYWMWLSLLGAVVCVGVMFVINWWTALITQAIVTALYLYVHYRKPEINWGSSTQAHVYRNALQSTLKLISVEEHVKNFRPQIMVMSGYPSERPALIDFAANITKNISLMVCGHIHKVDDNESLMDPRSITRDAYQWLAKRKVKAFYNPVMAASFRAGAQALLQCIGTGKLRPNTLLVGFKSNWHSSHYQEVQDYFRTIHDAFDLHYGVGILRLAEGFHSNAIVYTSQVDDASSLCRRDVRGSLTSTAAIVDIPSPMSPSSVLTAVTPMDDAQPLRTEEEEETYEKREKKESTGDVTAEECEPLSGRKVRLEVLDNGTARLSPKTSPRSSPRTSPRHMVDPAKADRFKNKQGKGTIDVYWLFDDGGLTLLLPYILTRKSHWQNCKLRVFSPGTKRGELDREQRHMATLLSKFRIDYQDINILPDVGKKPSQASIDEYKGMIKDWMVDGKSGETEESHPWKITQNEIDSQKEKTMRHIRLREILQKHSTDANLIVMTLPMPKKGLCSAGLYMSWIETLTRDMPPILLIRGNQENVLTYYS